MPPPRTTTDEQYRLLLDYMEKNRDISVQGQDGDRAAQLKLWQTLVVKLNKVGPPRDATWWRRHWAEFKYKTKKKANLRMKGGTDVPPQYLPPLADVEERLLNLMGQDIPLRPDLSLSSSSSSMELDQSADGPFHMKWNYNLKTKPIESLQIVNPLNNVKMDADDADNDVDEPEIEWSDAPQRLSTSDNDEDILNDNGDKLKSEIDGVLAWAHDLEKKRVENETKMAEAVMALAKSQSEMARAQQSMAKALLGIRKDIQMYLGNKGADSSE